MSYVPPQLTREVAMAHLEGFPASAVGAMAAHWTRHDGDPDQARHTYRNQSIDPERTKYNYTLLAKAEDAAGISAIVRRAIEEADVKPREGEKGTNVLSSVVVTLPDERKLVGREREFFEACAEYIKEKVGEDRFIGAWVHMDETTPHVHIVFVPTVETPVMTNDKSKPLLWTERDMKRNPEHVAGTPKRDSKGTVRYERVPVLGDDGRPVMRKSFGQGKIFDRAALKAFHPELEARLEARFGFRCGVQLSAEEHAERTYTDLETFKRAARARSDAERAAEEARAERDELAARVEAAQPQVAEALDRLECVQACEIALLGLDEAAEDVAREVEGNASRVEGLAREAAALARECDAAEGASGWSGRGLPGVPDSRDRELAGRDRERAARARRPGLEARRDREAVSAARAAALFERAWRVTAGALEGALRLVSRALSEALRALRAPLTVPRHAPRANDARAACERVQARRELERAMKAVERQTSHERWELSHPQEAARRIEERLARGGLDVAERITLTQRLEWLRAGCPANSGVSSIGSPASRAPVQHAPAPARGLER